MLQVLMIYYHILLKPNEHYLLRFVEIQSKKTRRRRWPIIYEIVTIKLVRLRD